MIIENQEYFKLTLSLIYYSIYFSGNDSYKIAEFFSVFVNNLFHLDTSKLFETLYSNNKNNFIQKNIDYSVTNNNVLSNGNVSEKNISINSPINDVIMDISPQIDLHIFNDKDLNYTVILEKMKNKNPAENIEIEKFYNIDKLASLIYFNKGKENKSGNNGKFINLEIILKLKKIFFKFFIFFKKIKECR